MAHVPADGPLGIEGRHQFKGGDQMPPGANNEYSVFMYGSHSVARAVTPNSWIKIDRITGIHALGDADDFREPAEGRVGEVVYPSAQRGKTMVYEGRVVGLTLPQMRQQAANLRRAAAETRERVTGSITSVDPADTGEGYAIDVRCIALDMDDVQAFGPSHLPSAYVRPFSLGVRAHDPRWRWNPESSSIGNANASLVTLENEGNAPAELKIDVIAGAGPLVAPITVQNLTLGVRLQFDTIEVEAGNLMRIDFRQRAIVRPEAIEIPVDYTPNVDLMPHLNLDESDWWSAMEWGLGPGDNDIRVTTASGNATWSAWWQHTSY